MTVFYAQPVWTSPLRQKNLNAWLPVIKRWYLNQGESSTECKIIFSYLFLSYFNLRETKMPTNKDTVSFPVILNEEK